MKYSIPTWTLLVTILMVGCSAPKPFRSDYKDRYSGELEPNKKIAYLGFLHFHNPDSKMLKNPLPLDEETLLQQIQENVPSEFSERVNTDYFAAVKKTLKYNIVEDYSYLKNVDNGNQIFLSFLQDNHNIVDHKYETDPSIKHYYRTYNRLSRLPYLGGSSIISKKVSGPAFEKMSKDIEVDYFMYSVHYSADFYGSTLGLVSAYWNSWSNIVMDYIIDAKTGSIVETNSYYLNSPLSFRVGGVLLTLTNPTIEMIEDLNFKTFGSTLLHNRGLANEAPPIKYVPLVLPGVNKIKLALPLILSKNFNSKNPGIVTCTIINNETQERKEVNLVLDQKLGNQIATYVALENEKKIGFATYILIDDLREFLNVESDDHTELVNIFIQKYKAGLYSFKIKSDILEHDYEF